MASKAEQLKARLGANIAESTASGKGGSGPASAIPSRRVDPKEQGTERSRDARDIEIANVVPDPDQPRKNFPAEALEVMAASLRARGQLMPIRVRWSPSLEKWVIVAGERRYRGAMMAGLTTLKAMISTATDSADILADQLIENIVRENLDPMEEAEAFARMMESEGISQRGLAEKLGISQGRIAQRVALLDLPDSAKESVAMGDLAASSGYLISQAPEARQGALAAEAVEGGLTRSEVQEKVDRAIRESPDRPGKPRRKAPPRAKAAGLATTRRFRTATKVRITAERAAPFDRAALLAALREAADLVAQEIGEPALA